MYPALQTYCDTLSKNFDKIPSDRKIILEKLIQHIKDKRKKKETIRLVYICTHNSRRSHFGQIWAWAAANYYHASDVETFSAGTEATAFNINAIDALKRAGFSITVDNQQEDTMYLVSYEETQPPINCFSKTIQHSTIPKDNFAAVMTCSEAEENCPFIPGAELRIGTTYEDPKVFDGTTYQNEKYDERCWQIALECFYVFSKI